MNMVDTGLRFSGHPIFLGPLPNGHKADKIVLTRLDRFLRKHFPFLINFGEQKETLVNGANPPKSKKEND